jgi:peptidoglycan-associated lipoprotein
MFDHAVTAPTGTVVAADGSISPSSSLLKDQINTSFGLTWQHRNGVMLGAAVNYRFGLESPGVAGTPVNSGSDAFGFEFRIGFHRGVSVYTPPPPAVALAPAPAPAPVPEPVPAPVPAPAVASIVKNRPPVVRAQCDPCSVEPGASIMLRAISTDPDGDPLTYRWTASGGSLAEARAANTKWVAETSAGYIRFTVTVEDSSGAIASDSVTLEVRDDQVELEDVHFDFNSAALRPESLSLLEPTIAALNARPQSQLVIEGYTCNVGSLDYNIALGLRRANAVRDYLVKRGIDGRRVSVASYGEERPISDNTTPDGRSQNRRAALVVRSSN